MAAYTDVFDYVLSGASSPWRSDLGAPAIVNGKLEVSHEQAVSRAVSGGSYVQFDAELNLARNSSADSSLRWLAAGPFPNFNPAPPTGGNTTGRGYPATAYILRSSLEPAHFNDYFSWTGATYRPAAGQQIERTFSVPWFSSLLERPLDSTIRVAIFLKATLGQVAMSLKYRATDRHSAFISLLGSPYNFNRVILFAPPETRTPPSEISLCFRVQSARVIDELDDATVDAANIAYQSGGPDAVEDLLAPVIPSFSTLFPASTGKPSHARILRAHRTPEQAQAFHELIQRSL